MLHPCPVRLAASAVSSVDSTPSASQPSTASFARRAVPVSLLTRLRSLKGLIDMTQTVARLLAESLEAHDVDQVYCVPGESYVGLTSALIEKQFDPRRRLPARGRRRLYGGGRRAAARPRRGGDGVARAGSVERDGVAAFGLSRRDPGGDAGRPGRAPAISAGWRCRSRIIRGSCRMSPSRSSRSTSRSRPRRRSPAPFISPRAAPRARSR